MKITVNGTRHDLGDIEPDMPLLWALRDELHVTGVKYGCGVAQCGACTVQVDGMATLACQTIVGDVADAEIVTIEGLGAPGALHAVQEAWIEHQVAQCGYCQPGQIMAAASFLRSNTAPTDAEIDAALSGNLCRCGTYPRVRTAMRSAARKLRRA